MTSENAAVRETDQMDTAGFLCLAQCNTEPKLGSQHNIGFQHHITECLYNNM